MKPTSKQIIAVQKILKEAPVPERSLDEMYWNGKNMRQMSKDELKEVLKELEVENE